MTERTIPRDNSPAPRKTWRMPVAPELLRYLSDPRGLEIPNSDSQSPLPDHWLVLEPENPPKAHESDAVVLTDYILHPAFRFDPIAEFRWLNDPFSTYSEGYYSIGGGCGFDRLAEDPVVRANLHPKGSIPDVFQLGEAKLVASPRFLKAIVEFGVSQFATRAIEFTEDSDRRFEGYVLFDPTCVLDAYDYERCQIVAVKKDGLISVQLGSKLALRSQINPSAHIFRDHYQPTSIFFLRPLARHLRKQGMTGLYFTDPATGNDAFRQEALTGGDQGA